MLWLGAHCPKQRRGGMINHECIRNGVRNHNRYSFDNMREHIVVDILVEMQTIIVNECMNYK